MNDIIHIPIMPMAIMPIYKFEDWLFEYSRTKPLEPWPLCKDYEPRKRAGKKFYEMLGRFLELSEEEQKELECTE